jgi:hypothetical protein
MSCYGIFKSDLEVYKRVVLGITMPAFIFGGFIAVKSQIIPSIMKKPALTMDDKGIGFPDDDCVITWANLESVEMRFSRQGKTIHINVKDAHAILVQLSPEKRGRELKKHGGKRFVIVPLGLAGNEDIYEVIRTFYREYGREPHAIMFHHPGRETRPSE